MTSIKDITGLPKEIQRIRKADDMKKAGPTGTSKTSNAVKTNGILTFAEKVSISRDAKELLEQQNGIEQKSNLRNLVDIDAQRLGDIEDKISSGFYNSDEVLDNVADELLALPIFHDSSAVRAQSNSGSEKSARHAEIREKIQNGKYDSDEVYEVVVTKIIESL